MESETLRLCSFRAGLWRMTAVLSDIAGCIKSALSGPRQRDAGHIANQRNADACERHTKKLNLAEHNKTTKHCQPDNEQER
jgi:hypothetical protein